MAGGKLAAELDAGGAVEQGHRAGYGGAGKMARRRRTRLRTKERLPRSVGGPSRDPVDEAAYQLADRALAGGDPEYFYDDIVELAEDYMRLVDPEYFRTGPGRR